MGYRIPRRSVWYVIAATMALFSGCAQHTLPRIDPTGQRIFLPSPYGTTLSDVFTHRDLNGQSTGGLVPNSAFPTPPPPPACLAGTPEPTIRPVGTGLHGLHQDRGECGQLLMTPLTMVAPVNGEVVVLAGICGEDGYLVTGEPIEWMLSPESVGTLLEVGDDSKGKPLRSWKAKPKVEKLGVDYALGRTSREETRITRGSPKCTDDLLLKKGQTWVSLTSPTEGVTRLTAFAPDSQVWNQRRQTATIYWVDAQWQFPSPQNLPSNQPAQLLTRVYSAEGFVGAEGWKVRYRSLNPDVALLGDSRSEIAESRVDSDGNAVVTAHNVSGKSGTAVIAISVIRPANGTQKVPELTLGQGQTMVSWSTPELLLRAAGPGMALPNQNITYSASLANAGDLTAENAELRVVLPAGMQLVDVLPPPKSLPGGGETTTSGARWLVGAMPPRTQLDVTVITRATAPNDYQVSFQGSGAGLPVIERKVMTRVDSPRVALRMEPAGGVQQVEVNQRVLFNLDVVNQGNQVLSDLELTATSDSGLEHTEQGGTLVSRRLGPLPPGQSAKIGLEYVVKREGQLCTKVVAKAVGATLGETSACVVGVPAVPKQPGVTLMLGTPNADSRLAINQTNTLRAEVRNTGQLPLRNVVLSMVYDPALEPIQATQGFRLGNNPLGMDWSLGDLPVGQNISVSVELRGVSNNPQAAVRFEVTTQDQARAAEQFFFSVGAGGGPPPVLPGMRDGVPANPPPGEVLPRGNLGGNLGGSPYSILIRANPTQARIGESLRYAIAVRNESGQDDQQLVMELRYGPGLLVDRFASIGRNLRQQYSEGLIRTEPIAYVRPGEVMEWEVTLRSGAAKEYALEVVVTSARNPRGVVQQSSAAFVP